MVSLFFFLGCTAPSKIDSLDKLEAYTQQAFQSVDGQFAMAFCEIGKPENKLLINAKEDFHAASTMKTPVMMELYKQAAQGRFNLDDSIEVKNSFYSIVDSSVYQMDIGQDSEGKLYDMIGKKLSIRRLMFDMITYSSNLATNVLIDLVDAKKVTQSLRDLGIEDMLVLRGVEDIKAYEQGLSNRTTAFDLMEVFRLIGEDKIVSQAACKEMTEVLLQQAFNDIIPTLLPEGTPVAHKTGSITGVRHDSGIVFLPDGRKYVLVLLSKEMPDPEAGIKMFNEVSQQVYTYMN